jgi:hypothetical protein
VALSGQVLQRLDPLEDERDLLASSLARSVTDLRRALPPDLPSPGVRGRQLVRYLVEVLDGIDTHCAALAATTPTSDLEAAAIMREFQNLRQYVQELESARWLDSVSTSSVELGLVYFLEEVAREVLVRESDFALHPGRSEGYSVMSPTRWFEVVLGRLGRALPDGPNAVLVNLPKADRDRPLLHPIFVHEVGHVRVTDDNLAEAVLSRHPDPVGLEASFTSAVEEIAKRHEAAGNPPDRDEIRLQLRTVLLDWVAELTCDEIPLAWSGPTFLLALPPSSFPMAATKQVPRTPRPLSECELRSQ